MNQAADGPHSITIVDQAERFKVAQALYAAVTAKTEKLVRSHSIDCLISKSDLDQLEAKCQQACTQWTKLNDSTSVSIHHLDDEKETFSSYERFNLYDVSKTSPVESVVYVRNLLLALPRIEKPQPYKITVRVLSRVALFNRMEREMPPPGFLRFFTSGSIVVEIEYVDYVVARNLLTTIDAWVKEVEQVSEWSFAKKLQPYTQWLPRVFTVALVVLSLVVAIGVTDEVLPPESTAALLAQWLLFAGTCIWVTGLVAKVVGRWVEHSIDSIVSISAIKINKGDNRLIADFKRKNVGRVIRAAIGVGGIIAQGVAINAVSPHVIDLFK